MGCSRQLRVALFGQLRYALIAVGGIANDYADLRQRPQCRSRGVRRPLNRLRKPVSTESEGHWPDRPVGLNVAGQVVKKDFDQADYNAHT